MKNRLRFYHLKTFVALLLTILSITFYMLHYYSDVGDNYKNNVEVFLLRNNEEILLEKDNNFPVLKGDKVILKIDVKAMNLKNAKVLSFSTANASVVAFENNGDLIYEMGTSLNKNGEGEIISNIFPQITVDRLTSDLRVELNVVNTCNNFTIDNFYSYDSNRSHMYSFIFNIFIWVSLFTVIAYIFYMIFLMPFMKYDKRVLLLSTMIGSMILLIAVWTLAKTGYYSGFFKEIDLWIRINNYIKFMLPTVFFGYFAFIVNNDKYILARKTMFVINLFFGIIALFISFVFGKYYHELNFIHRLIIVLDLGLAVYGFTYLTKYKKMDLYESIMFVGLIVFLVVLLILKIQGYLNIYLLTGVLEVYAYVFAGLIFSLIFIYAFILKTINLFYEKEIKLKDSKQVIYNTQIIPHFIFNSLAAINEMIHKDADYANDLLCDFSKYLRSKIDFNVNKENLICFGSELEHIQAYLNIENAKLNNKYNIQINAEATDFYVPYLSVQPFIENSIRHGLLPKANGNLLIKSYETEEFYNIHIADDGIGFNTKDNSKNDRIGINNSISRLKEMVNANVEIISEIDVGTTVIIRIPKRGEIK